MEYLHRCLGRLKTSPGFKFHPRCDKLDITHISFADDLMLFARGDLQSVETLMNKFQKFSCATGLKAHPGKCRVYFGGVEHRERKAILASTGFSEGELPFKYLGVPLSSKKLTIPQCRPLVDKIVAKIKHWTSRLLSYAGRWQLIQSVLFAVTAYWMQVFPLPQGVMKQIEAICRSFLWSGTEVISKKAPIAWEQVCEPKNAGGLNITALATWNKATMGKLLWNIQAKADKLWIKWLDTYYIKGQDLNTWQVAATCSWVVKKIMDLRDTMSQTEHWATAIHSGKYVTGTMYKELRGDRIQVCWRKILFTNYARPRAIFTLWMALRGRLPTRDRLHKFGMTIERNCCFCDAEESLEHLFFMCKETKLVWRKVLLWMGIDRRPMKWNDEVATSRKKGIKNQLLKVAFAETVYSIWRNRNDKIFNHKDQISRSYEEIIHNVKMRSSLHRKLSLHISQYA
ncbi:uncharacterized protein LOC131598262 [Vicia villosa]|uniref:uncharacterized protein LOC131598262 n=1 Tax=Vicia villosa TaxID=3911 RepID=UPI00273A7AE9|nr:uncharacterized protein LOC131598262 [Vicia villosa]